MDMEGSRGNTHLFVSCLFGSCARLLHQICGCIIVRELKAGTVNRKCQVAPLGVSLSLSLCRSLTPSLTHALCLSLSLSLSISLYLSLSLALRLSLSLSLSLSRYCGGVVQRGPRVQQGAHALARREEVPA